MPKTTSRKSTPTRTPNGPSDPVVISMGCPRGVGPEVVLASVFSTDTPSAVIVGSRSILKQAAVALGASAKKVEGIAPYEPGGGIFRGVRLLEAGPSLKSGRRLWGKPSAEDGIAQLTYIESGYEVAKREGWPLVTAPVSKEVIAYCGLRRAHRFLGHTEWLESLDNAPHSVMCFAADRIATSLVTTHVPVRRLSKLITPELVSRATLELVDLLSRAAAGKPPLVAVCSLNPHGGEGTLLGNEEASAIAPGIVQARRAAGRRARIVGPVGAETAFRKAASGAYNGVVAMYHDQATIPMKLLSFGEAVNITQGLSIVRTSVDHGTAYDIAGKGVADPRGMKEAMKWATRLAGTARKIPHSRF